MRNRKLDTKSREGQLSLQMIFFAAIVVILITGFIFAALSFLKLSVRSFNKSLAFSVAEAGIEYYRWHLAHSPTDYQDGTGGPGPYTHNYYDKSGVKIGEFILSVTPPPTGSTIVNVQSTGRVAADSSLEKVIKVKMGIPSFAKYAWALNGEVNFGSAAEVFGPIHSNAGIRFDGLAHNLVTSALTSYDDPDHSGANEFAVHTHRAPVDPLPPTAVPSRPDVFQVGRQFPVPAVDFVGITQDLSEIRANASSSGFYRVSSTALGYEMILKTDDTFDLRRVTVLVPPGSCSGSAAGWGTWSIQSSTLIGTYSFPSNGLIFLEDDVWVRGQISTARLTIGSGRFPNTTSTRSNIIVNGDLLYTNYDGQDVIGLIAQNNVTVGLVSDDDLRIDGALMAQNGRVGRYSYSQSACGSTRGRAKLTSYGMLGSNTRPAFYYSATNGYQERDYIYDANLLYGPPPSFPLTSDNYVQISWEEVK